MKQWLAEHTNEERLTGPLSRAMAGADVFIGVSGADVLTADDVKAMARDPLVFALANPDPEIHPELAMPHAAVVATGRSDHPDQINNVLCFPGFFRGMLDVRARRVTDAMKIAASNAIAADHFRRRVDFRLHCSQRVRSPRGAGGGPGSGPGGGAGRRCPPAVRAAR